MLKYTNCFNRYCYNTVLISRQTERFCFIFQYILITERNCYCLLTL